MTVGHFLYRGECPFFLLMTIIILILATWRVTSLLTAEQGPFGILDKIRHWGIPDCLWCMSIWVAIFFTGIHWYSSNLAFLIALPFALSAGAILFDRYSQ